MRDSDKKTPSMHSSCWPALLYIAITLAPTALLADITLAGSSTIQPIAQEVAKAFSAKTGIRVSIKGGGSGAGLQAGRDGSVDIGMVSRALTAEESDGLSRYLIGYDGIAIIVNSANPMQGMTKEQAKDIYSGKTTNWQPLCGTDIPITVIAKHKGRSTRALFDDYLALDQMTPAARLGGPNAEVIVLVGSDPAAIGYVSIGSVEQAMAQGVRIKALDLAGVAATQDNIIAGTYPIVRELNLITKGEPGDEARQFIEFFRGPDGQNILKKQSFITTAHKAK